MDTMGNRAAATAHSEGAMAPEQAGITSFLADRRPSEALMGEGIKTRRRALTVQDIEGLLEISERRAHEDGFRSGRRISESMLPEAYDRGVDQLAAWVMPRLQQLLEGDENDKFELSPEAGDYLRGVVEDIRRATTNPHQHRFTSSDAREAVVSAKVQRHIH